MKRVVLAVVILAAIAGIATLAVQRARAVPPPGTLYGNVEIREVTLSFNAEGAVRSMARREGDRVKAGDALAELDDATNRTALALAVARRDQSKAQLDLLLAGTRAETIDQARAALAGAKFDAVHSLDLPQDTWEKYTFLTAMAGMTCLMRASVGAIMATRDGEALTREIYAECCAVAAAANRAPRPKASAAALAMLTDPSSSVTASMLRDLEAGGSTEGEHIIGDMLERARAAGLDAPLLRVARCHLQAYEVRRRG